MAPEPFDLHTCLYTMFSSSYICSYEIKEPKDGTLGAPYENGSWSGVIGQIIRKVN